MARKHSRRAAPETSERYLTPQWRPDGGSIGTDCRVGVQIDGSGALCGGMAVSLITRERLEVEARSLPREERARLAEALLASLEEEAEIERAWREEIGRRAAELDSGAVQGVPAEEVFAAIDEILEA